MNRNISRIQAENDLRAMRVTLSTQMTPNAVKELAAQLKKETGDVYRVPDLLDKAGLTALKNMGSTQ